VPIVLLPSWTSTSPVRYAGLVRRFFAPTADPPDTAKIHWVGPEVNGVCFDRQRAYPAAPPKHMPESPGTNAAPSAFLITDAADKGCYSDQPGLLDAEFHAKREPCKFRAAGNHDVPKSHRHKKPPATERSQASLAQPSRDEGRGPTKAGKIAGGRTQERRKTAHGTPRTPAIQWPLSAR